MSFSINRSRIPFYDLLVSFVGNNIPTAIALTAKPESRGSCRLTVKGDVIEIERVAAKERIVIARRNPLYARDMMDAFDFFFSSVEPVMGADGYLVVDYSKNADHKVVGFSDFPVRFTTMAEPMSTTDQYLTLSGLGPGQNVLDLGCYCGLTSIVFSKVVGSSGRVLAVDADATNLANARINLERHERASGLHNVEVVEAAVSPHQGEVFFSTEGTMGSAPVGVVGRRRGLVRGVPGMTLQNLAERLGGRVDFVKMDIEGSERGLLDSAGDFIAEHRPIFIVEPHHVRGVPTYPEIVEILQRHGYSCRLEEQDGVEGVYLPLVVGLPGTATGLARNISDGGAADAA